MHQLAENGMYYVGYMDIEDTKEFAVYKQSVTDEISLEKCIQLFEECKENGTLEDGSFEDDKWYGYNPVNDIRLTLSFDILATKDIVLRMKKYVIAKLCLCHAAILTVYTSLLYIKKMLTATNMLKSGYETDFAVYIKEHSDYAEHCRDFLNFTTLENAGSYNKAIEGIHSNKSKPRDIPDYESVILLDLIIKDYIDHCDFEHKVKYYPVFIWWVLSTIIPLRPTEVLMLERNCIYKKDKKFFIHIERIKNIGSRRKNTVPIMKEFQISVEVYQFLNDYCDYVNSMDDGTYLIPYTLYTQEKPILDGRKRKKINPRHFEKLLQKFLHEVVEENYGYVIVPVGARKEDNQIERIRMGDTRHLAFVNMLMQGMNPLYIQRIGGHRKLEEQLHYCAHLDSFASAKAYALSKALKNKMMTNCMEIKDWAIMESRKDLLGLDFYSLPKVKGGAGRCTSVNVPGDCISDECLFCQHFIPERNVSQDYMEEMQAKNAKDIKLKKETLKFLLIDVLKNEKEIDGVSKSLAALVNQKLIIDSYIMNTKGDNST